MPTDACQFYYECVSCGAVIRPEPGDCCVFCSFADIDVSTQAGGSSQVGVIAIRD